VSRGCGEAEGRSEALAVLKTRVREITGRSRGRSMASVVLELRRYLGGWKNYFQFTETPTPLLAIDKWIRHRLRALQLCHWKRGRTIYRELRRRGVIPELARAASMTGHWWRISLHKALCIALPARYFDELGVPRLAD
jgi:RNA-directed DNA polymerase